MMSRAGDASAGGPAPDSPEGGVLLVPVYRPDEFAELATRYCGIADGVWSARQADSEEIPALCCDQRPIDAIAKGDATHARMLLVPPGDTGGSNTAGDGFREVKRRRSEPQPAGGARDAARDAVADVDASVIDGLLSGNAEGGAAGLAARPGMAHDGGRLYEIVLGLGAHEDRAPVDPDRDEDARRLVEDWAERVLQAMLAESNKIQREVLAQEQIQSEGVQRLSWLKIASLGIAGLSLLIAVVTLVMMVVIDRDKLDFAESIPDPTPEISVPFEVFGETEVEPLTPSTGIRVGDAVSFVGGLAPEGYHDLALRVLTPARSDVGETLIREHGAEIGERPVTMEAPGTLHYLVIRTSEPLSADRVERVRGALSNLTATRATLSRGLLVEWDDTTITIKTVGGRGEDDEVPKSMREALERTQRALGEALTGVAWSIGGRSFPVADG